MKTRAFLFGLLSFVAIPVWASDPADGLIVHEWGSFTCVQGRDGMQMDWNPLVAPELPSFVYDRQRPGSASKAAVRIQVAGKTGTMSRQRMETPVIYFYTDKEQTADVAIKFPEGSVTEWYPQVQPASMAISGAPAATEGLALHWTNIQILPKADSAKAILPNASGSHYAAARQTDSSVLRVPGEKGQPEVEKFLFYRGVANFQAPLTVKLAGSDARQVTVTNTGGEELKDLFLYQVDTHGDNSLPAGQVTGRWIWVDRLAPGESRELPIETVANSIGLDGLRESLRAALVRHGLYEREAAAMIETWDSSWFAERGMRVLYVLPRKWTDGTLPLAITPKPTAIERVMVARAEVITPQMEQDLLGVVQRYIAAPAQDRGPIVAAARALGLGRFTEPTLRRLSIGIARSPAFSSLSWELLQAASLRPAPVASR